MLGTVTAPEPSQYDAFASTYEAHAEVAPYNALYDRPATLSLLGEVGGKRVFDAACGPGIYAAELLARGASVVGCDASAEMVALARARVGDRADLRTHPLEEPLAWVPDGSIDVVLCALAYHYLNDRPAFLGEARRVLGPDGVLLISTHHPTDDWLRLGGSYFDEIATTERWSKGFDVTAWRLPLTRLTGEFADAGFVIERLVEPRPLPEMATSYPQAHEKLTTRPAFVLFRLRPA